MSLLGTRGRRRPCSLGVPSPEHGCRGQRGLLGTREASLDWLPGWRPVSGGQLGWPWGHPEVISGRRVAAPSIWAIGPFRADRCSDTGGQVKPLWCGVRGGGQGGVASQTQTRSCGAGRGFRAGLQVSTPTLALGPTSQDVLSPRPQQPWHSPVAPRPAQGHSPHTQTPRTAAFPTDAGLCSAYLCA